MSNLNIEKEGTHIYSYKKRRRGNLVIVVTCFLILTASLVPLFTFSYAQQANARIKAETAGDANTYITLANLCAYAFKDDLEAQSVQMVVATVEDPDASNVSMDVCHTAIEDIQESLTAANVPEGWKHTLTNPYDAVEFAGLRDETAKVFASELLQDASVEITVLTPLEVTLTPEATDTGLDGGAKVQIKDIEYIVELRAGSWCIRQSYRLVGEMLEGRLVGSKALLFVDGVEAVCQMETQAITKTANT